MNDNDVDELASAYAARDWLRTQLATVEARIETLTQHDADDKPWVEQQLPGLIIGP